MPSIRYYNQTAPFWDMVASLENQGAEHPWFGGRNSHETNAENNQENGFGWAPWAGPPGGFPFRGPPPHQNHRGGPPHHHRGPPPPPPADSEDVPPPSFEEKEDSPATVQNEKGESSKAPQEDSSEEQQWGRDRCGGRGLGGAWGRRGHCGGPGKRGRGGPFGGARGGFPFGPLAFGPLGGFASQFFPGANEESSDNYFKPEADVFDTETAYVIHLSLPGGKKEDLSVTWDAEKSEVAVSGVVHRPGDEEFLKTLAMDERKIGAFERKIRLGSLANPAQVDADSISAKLEDGILRVEVPKLDKDYVEVKMVDIE